MHTSQAATTMTMIAKTWPSMLAHIRENAMSAMFAALSMSSRQRSTTSGLRRVSTPPAPMQNTSAETIRNQSMFIASTPAGGRRWPRSSNDAQSPDALRRRLGALGRPAGGAGVLRRAEAADRRADPALDRLGHRADARRAQERHRADADLHL